MYCNVMYHIDERVDSIYLLDTVIGRGIEIPLKSAKMAIFFTFFLITGYKGEPFYSNESTQSPK